MTAFANSSVLLPRYLAEARTHEASELVESSPIVVVSRLADIEVRRGLAMITSTVERSLAQSVFAQEFRSFVVVELDPALVDLAATVAVNTGVRSLDSIHIASALVSEATRFLTFDARQAAAARACGLTVVGVDPAT